MKTFLVSVVLGNVLAAAAFGSVKEPLPAFDDTALSVPGLTPSDLPGPESWVLPPAPYSLPLARHRAIRGKRTDTPARVVSAMPVVEPREAVDARMPVLAPSPEIDYKLVVKTPEVASSR
ncbi:MAG: hypothetical protein JNN01_09720 [Opitutaceae bacterium]|nr:hypothetical protein [Opitutaceae bacterium]